MERERLNHTAGIIGTIAEIAYPKMQANKLFVELGIAQTETRGEAAVKIIDRIIEQIASGYQPTDDYAESWNDVTITIEKNGRKGEVNMADFIRNAHRNYSRLAEAMSK